MQRTANDEPVENFAIIDFEDGQVIIDAEAHFKVNQALII